jgi:hypothetical protein
MRRRAAAMGRLLPFIFPGLFFMIVILLWVLQLESRWDEEGGFGPWWRERRRILRRRWHEWRRRQRNG